MHFSFSFNFAEKLPKRFVHGGTLATANDRGAQRHVDCHASAAGPPGQFDYGQTRAGVTLTSTRRHPAGGTGQRQTAAALGGSHACAVRLQRTTTTRATQRGRRRCDLAAGASPACTSCGGGRYGASRASARARGRKGKGARGAEAHHAHNGEVEETGGG